MKDIPLLTFLDGKNNAVLLETVKAERESYVSFLFLDPVEIVQAYSLDDIADCFRRIDHALEQGYFAAGYLTYECGFHFENIPYKEAFNKPLLWFGIYDKPVSYNHSTGQWNREPRSEALNPKNGFSEKESYSIDRSVFSIDGEDEPATLEGYSKKILQIKKHIEDGDVYQVNYTGRIRFQYSGSEYALYESLKKKQRVSYGALMKTEHQTILSFSPELFFRRKGTHVTVRPMKGTIKRGRTLKEDAELSSWLANDPKSRAENVMIVDVLRNDLGKIAEIGSVKTTSLYTIEKYDSLFQMTSTVEAEIPERTSSYELFKALFPCGSVTGAPKRRAIEIIQNLEADPRGIYTGAIGYIAPNKDAVFNIAIRTVELENFAPSFSHIRTGIMGTGGGIVWDSNAEDELHECELKAQFLQMPYVPFKLIETMLWDNGCLLLDKHLERLQDSSSYFGFQFHREEIAKRLKEETGALHADRKYKVRLLLDEHGNLEIEHVLLSDNQPGELFVRIAEEQTDSSDRFLFHKTTRRELYEKKAQEASALHLADFIFRNERNEITEGATHNLFIQKDGLLLTPPIECGLLPGVFRRHLIETEPNIKEQTIFLEDLKSADAIFLCNAVRGLRNVTLIM